MRARFSGVFYLKAGKNLHLEDSININKNGPSHQLSGMPKKRYFTCQVLFKNIFEGARTMLTRVCKRVKVCAYVYSKFRNRK